MYIENIEVTAETIRNAILYFCKKTTDERGRTINTKPTFIPSVENKLLYNYFILFGIRVNSCDTSIPDDIIGGMRYVPNKFSGGGHWELEFANASTDPSPLYQQPPVNKVNGKCPSVTVKMPSGRNFTVYPSGEKNRVAPCNEAVWSSVGTNPFKDKCCVYFDSQARNEGGAAWIAPGQYLYYFRGNFFGEPAFGPAQPVVTYRWAPSRQGETFSPSRVVKESPNSSILIHRTWFKDRLFYDSAGCNVIPSKETLLTLAKWAKSHLAKKYPRNFQYTLITKEDFVAANTMKKSPEKSWWETIFNF